MKGTKQNKYEIIVCGNEHMHIGLAAKGSRWHSSEFSSWYEITKHYGQV